MSDRFTFFKLNFQNNILQIKKICIFAPLINRGRVPQNLILDYVSKN